MTCLQKESGDGTAASQEAAGLEARGGVAGLLDGVVLAGGGRAGGGRVGAPGAVAGRVGGEASAVRRRRLTADGGCMIR